MADIRKFFGAKPNGSSPAKPVGAETPATKPKSASASKRSQPRTASHKTKKASDSGDDDYNESDSDLEVIEAPSIQKRASQTPSAPEQSKRSKKLPPKEEEVAVSSYFGSTPNEVKGSTTKTAPSKPKQTKSQQPAAEVENIDELQYGSLSVDEDELDLLLSEKRFKDAPTPAVESDTGRKRKATGGSTDTSPKKAAVAKGRNANKTASDDTVTAAPPQKKNYSDLKARQQAVNMPLEGSVAEIPTGAENCLAGLTFVFTGVLRTLPRNDGVDLVKRHGGRVTTAPSRNTNYIVLGEDAGEKKLETIKKLNIPTIDEDGLFKLIRELPANGGNSEAAKKYAIKAAAEEKKIQEMAQTIGLPEPKSSVVPTPSSSSSSSQPSKSARTLLWTDKYAPTSLKDICGNKGVVTKLQDWLNAWQDNLRSGFKKPGKDGSGTFRAVMIHGPPGIGKTTSAHLVAKLSGFDIIETNASDTRSKNVVAETFAGVLDNTSLLGYFGTKGKAVETSKKKIVLIMDEVDGMSAGDRGGVGQMAQICKATHIPIILICNDYSLPKMRPFDKVAFALPFRRPEAAMIRSRILSIAYREGLKIPTPVIDQLVLGSHSDIRQIINLLSTFCVNAKEMDFDQGKAISKAWEKHIVMKPFDIAGQLLGGSLFSANSSSTLNDKIELYFNDHDFSPLMIQENYLRTRPQLARSSPPSQLALKNLELLDRAASSISDGDLCDRMIHGSQQQWSLMPLHAILSTVRPAAYISGPGTGERYNFPAWLGKTSSGNKLMRYLQEIQSHARLRISGDRYEVRLQYMTAFFNRLYGPLATSGAEGIPDTIRFMDDYFLTKEDFDAIIELGVGGTSEELWKKIPTATKTAFTRKYNAMGHPVPFMRASAIGDPKKEKIKKEVPDFEDALDDVLDDGDDGAEEVDEKEEEVDEALDLKKDKYIKASSAKSKSTKATKPSTAKGKRKAV